ncbi:MAG: hypothetical protein NTX15_08770 [Candidatus Kapabacteria bacterium]|nr:hypothetical protein [Candidatus Kapabacteria bacterium]
MNRHLYLIVVAITTCLAVSAEAQVRFRVATGLSTDWITNDNPAVYRIAGGEDTSSTTNTFGGAFDGAQIGWGFRAYADLDKQKKFRIPIGVDYYSYKGTQAINGNLYKLRVTHENVLWTALTGFEWSFVEFPWAFARAYVGVEARLLNVGDNTITSTGTTIVNGEAITNTRVTNGKPSAWRLGALARLGIEGEIYYPVFVNTSVGWGGMNFIGRDTRPTSEGGRGELLTPTSLNESGEGILYHMSFTFMIQVRL